MHNSDVKVWQRPIAPVALGTDDGRKGREGCERRGHGDCKLHPIVCLHQRAIVSSRR
jgi:hypothetical protein